MCGFIFINGFGNFLLQPAINEKANETILIFFLRNNGKIISFALICLL